MSSAILRQASAAARRIPRVSAFSTSAAARKDFVQELYINQLKSYKAPAPAKDAHVGVVKTYSAPAAPQPPVLPADLASELSAYDSVEPVVEAKAPAASAEQVTTGAEQFLAFLEADEPKAADAHH
ncbi:hypothetical protein CERSUDRAFT_99194 [Gelatoporia subvermispora B]|uniref:Uncharacterized protein n=1 Tax=Ceriporiopsis subvermispora (strain B) TaxID=914234 RepID=M2R1R1_CERS8|nr:hypothetical protein CERSUDRAFT_99194 [Gelatoporia subvermispora B]